MAFDPTPSGFFPTIDDAAVVGGVTGVFIGYSDLESYDATVAAASGDIRQFIYSVIEKYTDTYLDLASSGRPTNLTVSRSSSVPSDGVLRKIYTITTNLAFSGLSVASE